MPPEEGSLTSKEMGASSINPKSLAISEVCPAPIRVPYGEIHWDPLCDIASWFKPLILLFAWLGAGYLVIGKAD